MREIKFRAWDGEKMIYPDYISRNGIAYWTENSIPETSKNLMQYTGLKDKNGVEIYEADIIRLDSFEPPNYEVKFIEGGFCLCFLDGKFKGESAADIHYVQHAGINQSTVIGNIYENPELLQTPPPHHDSRGDI